MFKGWYYNGQRNNCPSKEQQAKLDAYLLTLGIKKAKEIDPNFNYVDHFNKLVALKNQAEKSPISKPTIHDV